ncbi:FtsX-like permease family protein [Herbidospora sp. NEAU-GS84]|uniref:Cell division protein FtsX n=1 Tax=Herbidospora solisilvae TaxID=2696284 RepID=A0A7C9MYW0_9ACTN|nr:MULTISPECIES: permease-like cell division protein FtsX [Herbidospora]NAS24391.1 FtsX-like permease family protein [Herbidospora solisilvae]GLX98450.1 cell division protein FtsX [Herbidospora sp. NBRC 101105]
MRANFIFSEVWIGLRRNLTMTIAVIVTVAVGMALLGIGLMINSQVSSMTSYWSDKVELSVYLCKENSPFEPCTDKKGISEEQKTALEAVIKGMPQVEEVIFEDSATAYKNFLDNQSNNVFASFLKVEDMPESFRVKLGDPDQSAAVTEELTGQAGVSNIVNQRQLLDSYFGFMDKLQWMALSVAFAMVFAATLLIGNTVRLSAFNRRRETGIMRLVGASNVYIQLPFVLEGVIAGLIGGVLAAVMLITSKLLIFDSIQNFIPEALGWNTVAGIISGTMAIGVIICILASFITLRRYLRV